MAALIITEDMIKQEHAIDNALNTIMRSMPEEQWIETMLSKFPEMEDWEIMELVTIRQGGDIKRVSHAN